MSRSATTTTTTTVATETWREGLGECVVLLGIGCWGLDAFQSNLLLGCVGAFPPMRGEERESEQERERVVVTDRCGDV